MIWPVALVSLDTSDGEVRRYVRDKDGKLEMTTTAQVRNWIFTRFDEPNIWASIRAFRAGFSELSPGSYGK